MEQKKESNKIYRAIRMTSLRNLILPVIYAVIAVAVYYLMPFSDVFNPPKITSAASAEKMYGSGHSFVTVRAEKLYYTGFDLMSDDGIKASYYYEINDNRCTFYVLDGNMVKDRPEVLENVTIKAKLIKKNGMMESMMTSFAGSIGWTADGLKDVTNNVVIDETKFHVERYAGVFIILVGLVIYSVVLVTANMIFILFPKVHPSLLRYYASGQKGMRKSLSSLNEDFYEHQVFNAGEMYLTEKYFYNLGKREIAIVSIEDIVMAYDHGRLISVFGIHLTMTHTLHIIGINGEKMSVSGKSATEVMEITNYLKDYYPHILWGHTKENRQEAKEKIRQHKKHRKMMERLERIKEKKSEK